MWESFAGWHLAASLPSPPPRVGSSQALGPTWGPEVLGTRTFLMDFCGGGGRVRRRRGERGEVRPRAHGMSLGGGHTLGGQR